MTKAIVLRLKLEKTIIFRLCIRDYYLRKYSLIMLEKIQIDSC
jgi:hypothetical protein